MLRYLSNLQDRSLAFRSTILCLAQLLAFLIAWPIALLCVGGVGVAAVAVAAGLCLAGAGGALAIGDCLRRHDEVLVSLVTSMTIRLGVPLVLGVIIHLRGGPLAEAGLLYYLLFFYPVALTVGTILALPARTQFVARQETAQNHD